MSKRLKPEFFDIVIDERGGLLYSPNPPQTLTEMFKVMAPGATAYIRPVPRAGFQNFRNFMDTSWLTDWAKKHNAALDFKSGEMFTIKITKLPDQKRE
jgi:hypothetical protein